ncbi:MIT domain-containing protein 1 [Trichoplax sp. H2]|uniref:MIT domain-containing protein n=1 Tax=Trichoplax adhaerens TaxID=10228 RepID=B3RXW5_TRIAD|nr:hypothetical protein TRIADDRAFT_63941 [Trichoplax adhaerens]EDV24930.1 hypothetical protein TRIADDRAFT_63941 [Trichoplax adhaerens]RDD46750.1 MIT domain-containing protein 1 [Trichoplax sp. H2]|eukprot:XP_002112820.1 hypothetical protein TRIADDRAFT_63941 [Trichoplax adhaerens]
MTNKMNTASRTCQLAEECERSEDYEASLQHYMNGIELMMKILEDTKDEHQKLFIRDKVKKCLNSAEKVKSIIAQKKAKNKHSSQVTQEKISDGSTGYDYDTIFDRCLDDSVTSVEIDDPYIRNSYQVRNLVRISELLLRKTKVKNITLLTGQELEKDKRHTQCTHLEELRMSLQSHNVTFMYSFSDTLHNREIRFNNGWKVIIDRGLDYFKPFKSQFAIGYFDFNYRVCKETSVTYIRDAS